MKRTVTCMFVLVLSVVFNGYLQKGVCTSLPENESSGLEHGGRVVRSPVSFPDGNTGYSVDAEEKKKKRGWFNSGKLLGAGGRFDVFTTKHKAKVVESYSSGKVPRFPDFEHGIYTRRSALVEDDYPVDPDEGNQVREQRSVRGEEPFEDEADEGNLKRSARSPQFSGKPRIIFTTDRDNKANGFSNKLSVAGLHAKLSSKFATNVTSRKFKYRAPTGNTYQPYAPNQVYPPYQPVQLYQPPPVFGSYVRKRRDIGNQSGRNAATGRRARSARDESSEDQGRRAARSAQWNWEDPHTHIETDRDIHSNGFAIKAGLLGLRGRAGLNVGNNKTFTKFNSDSMNPQKWQSYGYNYVPPW